MKFEVLKKEIGLIDFNYDELKNQLENELSIYKNVVFDETQIVKAKETKASLNKIVDAIETRRKELKKEFMMPYEAFKAKTDELCNMVKEITGNIDEQLRAFEEARIEEKKVQIVEKCWMPRNYSKISLEQIWDNKWLNKTCSIKTIEEEIIDKINKIEADLRIIDEIKDGNIDEMKAQYLMCLDLVKTLDEFKRRKTIMNELKEDKLSSVDNQDLSMHMELRGTKTQFNALLNEIKKLNIRLINFEIGEDK